MYFDTFDTESDIDSPPPEAETNDSFCSDNDDFPCVKCKKRKDGKLCRKCHIRKHGNPEKPKKSPLELASTGRRPDRSDNSDTAGFALETFGLSKLTGPRSTAPDIPCKEEKEQKEEKKPRETNCRVTSALGQWVQYDHHPPQRTRTRTRSIERTRTQSIERRCQCSQPRRCARCENLPHQSNRRRTWEERDRSAAKTPKEEVEVEEVRYESTSWEFGNGYTHTCTHTHTHTHTHTKSVVRASDWERPYNPRLVDLIRPSMSYKRPRRHMVEIWSYTSGRRLSRWPVEFYVMPLCGTLTWPYGCGIRLGPGSLSAGDIFSLLWSMLSAWIAGKCKQLVASARVALGFGDGLNQGLEELD